MPCILGLDNRGGRGGSYSGLNSGTLARYIRCRLLSDFAGHPDEARMPKPHVYVFADADGAGKDVRDMRDGEGAERIECLGKGLAPLGICGNCRYLFDGNDDARVLGMSPRFR